MDVKILGGELALSSRTQSHARQDICSTAPSTDLLFIDVEVYHRPKSEPSHSARLHEPAAFLRTGAATASPAAPHDTCCWWAGRRGRRPGITAHQLPGGARPQSRGALHVEKGYATSRTSTVGLPGWEAGRQAVARSRWRWRWAVGSTGTGELHGMG